MSEESREQRAMRVIRARVESAGGNPGAVTLATTITDLGLDSLERIELVMDLEEEFPGLDVPDDFHWSRTVGELILLVVEPTA